MVLANSIALRYLYYYQQDVIHYRKPGQGQLILVTISTIATALAALFAGRLADRWGAYRMYVVLAMVLMAVAGYVLAAVGTWTIAVIAAAPLGAGYGYSHPPAALAARVLPDLGTAGRDLGIMNIASTVPQVIGPPVAAALIYLGGGYRGLIAFAATMALLAACATYKIRVPG